MPLTEFLHAEIDFLKYFLGTFVALFPMVNPFSTVPLYLSLTAGMPERHRCRQARRAAINAAVIMIVVLLIGGAVLHFFDISLGALRIAGGAIVAHIGFRMVLPAEATPHSASPERLEDDSEADVSLVPLAFPSLVGAGTMAVVLGMATHVDDIDVVHHRLYAYAVVGSAIAAVAFISWIVLRMSTKLVAWFGVRGLDAMSRIVGLLLVCIAVQFIATGIRMLFSN